MTLIVNCIWTVYIHVQVNLKIYLRLRYMIYWLYMEHLLCLSTSEQGGEDQILVSSLQIVIRWWFCLLECHKDLKSMANHAFPPQLSPFSPSPNQSIPTINWFFLRKQPLVNVNRLFNWFIDCIQKHANAC